MKLYAHAPGIPGTACVAYIDFPKKRPMKKPELLAPAGNTEKLVTALHYGADAVYLGLSDFSLRAKAGNFSPQELEDAACLIRDKGRKFYITVNLLPHNRDIGAIAEHIGLLRQIRPDGVIVSDTGIFEMVREIAPELLIHISTQANITNYRSAVFWERLGAGRLILSRELSIDEIREIRDNTSIELECFVHGAICISYSGRCYISSFLSNRSANRGECTNSCRWSYRLMEEKREGEYLPVHEDERGTYLLSSRDLCMIEHLDKLSAAGIDSFKIEGRMKGINYLAGVVKTYREAVDALGSGSYSVSKDWLRELSTFSSRGYTTGMFFGKQPDNGYNHDDEEISRMSYELVGVITSVLNGRGVLQLRNRLESGDSIQFLSDGLGDKLFSVTEIYDREENPVESARNDEIVTIPIQPGVRANDLVRRPCRR